MMAASEYPNSDVLVSGAWLAQHAHDPDVKIIDTRSAQDYAAGHIPGAVLLPNGAFRSTGGVPNVCIPDEFAAMAGALGVRATDTVICYDGTGGDRATRDGDGHHFKKKGIAEGGGLRDSRQSAAKLMGLHFQLCDALFGSHRTVAPPLPTAVDFVASLPEATPVFATTNRPRFPRLPRRLDSTAIVTFLSRHHPSPMAESKAIHRECTAMLS